jgi:hypothetical protein
MTICKKAKRVERPALPYAIPEESSMPSIPIAMDGKRFNIGQHVR